MTRLCFYIDEDSESHALLAALRSRDIDVDSASSAGLGGRDDEQQLAFAAAAGRVLYTANVGDFQRLHAAWLSGGRTHAGIVLVPQQRFVVGDQLRRVLRLMAARDADAMLNRVEYLSNWR